MTRAPRIEQCLTAVWVAPGLAPERR